MKTNILILVCLISVHGWAQKSVQGSMPRLDCQDVALQYQLLHEKKLAFEELTKMSNKSQRRDTLKAVIRESQAANDETLEYYEGAFEACQVEWNIQPKGADQN